MIPKKVADFIIAVTGNCIGCEGERQKYSKYNNVFRVFRFLSPTKLNRNELAGYSKAHSIQPLCLAGVVRLWTYTSFEALKVRDSKRLEPVQRYSYYEEIRKHSKKSTPARVRFSEEKTMYGALL